MPQIKKMEEIISIVLTIGVLISTFLVLLGGMLYLWQYGSNSISTELMHTSYSTNMTVILHTALAFSPVSLIELGLLCLVGTQVLRVALLVWFYSAMHDYLFTVISFFILSTLIYSLIWRN